MTTAKQWMVFWFWANWTISASFCAFDIIVSDRYPISALPAFIISVGYAVAVFHSGRKVKR